MRKTKIETHFLNYFFLTISTVVLALLVLAGCRSLPDVDTSVKKVALSTQKVDATLGQVNVILAPSDLRQGYLPPETQALTTQWHMSVIDALAQSQVFTTGSKRTVNIRINIIQITSKQNADLGITTTTVASYEVTDAASQELIWVRGISTSSTVSYQEATIQSTRERISLNRSIQSNITQFVQLFGHGRAEYQPTPPGELRIVQ